MATLTIDGIIKNGVSKGIKYIVPLLVNGILWGLTIWIPYLNVGTTIGLFVGITAKIARDEELEMTEIFDPKYRKRMGEYFLVMGFMSAGIMVGAIFMYIPAIVIAIAWGLAPLLVVDKGLTPIDAISKSNEVTYGKKWIIFLGYLVLYIIGVIVIVILMKIFSLISPILGALVVAVCAVLLMSMLIGAQAYVYGELTK